MGANGNHDKRTHIKLPLLHGGQLKAYGLHLKHRLIVVRCGRRWGKSELLKTIGCNVTARGKYFGYFAPAYKYMSEFYRDTKTILANDIASSSKTDGVILTRHGGRMDFWSTENEHAGRSRKYHGIAVDEVGLCKSNMQDVWNQAIRPTLLDYNGFAIMCGTPLGVNENDFFYQICNDKSLGFTEIHLPTHTNPHLSPEALEALERDNHPLVFRQEYLAEFVDWGGIRFFDINKLLVKQQPIPVPDRVDYVVAIMDTATKTGSLHDGTGVLYVAFGRGQPLYILDYDIVQIEGSLLEVFLNVIYEQIDHYCKLCNARLPSPGVLIEDKSSGMVLLQQAKRKGVKVHAIDSKLTSVGKDERAINISGYVHREQVKLCNVAYDKLITFKGKRRNHLLSQLSEFRLADKDANKREDDLLDCFTYAVALTLGNKGGF